jgi:hypothetical protein
MCGFEQEEVDLGFLADKERREAGKGQAMRPRSCIRLWKLF